MTVVLSIVIGIALWVLYHKIFDVYYFSGIKAIVAEIFVCWGLGGIIAGFIVKYAIIAILVIAAIIAITTIVKRNKGNDAGEDTAADKTTEAGEE